MAQVLPSFMDVWVRTLMELSWWAIWLQCSLTMPWQLRNSCGTHSLERFIISAPLASIQSCWWVTGEVECCWVQFGCNEWTKSPDATTTSKLSNLNFSHDRPGFHTPQKQLIGFRSCLFPSRTSHKMPRVASPQVKLDSSSQRGSLHGGPRQNWQWCL